MTGSIRLPVAASNVGERPPHPDRSVPNSPHQPSPADGQQITFVSRACLFSLPILAALGPHLGGVEAFGVNFFPYRIAVLAISLASVVLLPRFPWTRNRYMRTYVLIGCLWLAWALLGGLWARFQYDAVRGAFSIGFGFLAFLAVANLESWKRDALRWLIRGWVAAAILASTVALWELLTGNHLPGPWFADRTGLSRTVIASTFDNPNNFGVFLLLTLPVLLATLENIRAQLARTSMIALILVISFLSVLTTSRIAVYGFLLIGVAYLFRRPRLTATDIASIAIAGFLLAFLPVTQRLVSLLMSTDLRYITTILLQGSTLIRLNLAVIGIDMLVSTSGFGVGGGNFAPTLDAALQYSHLFTSGIIDPHNWWIEILSEYGIVMFSLYFGFLFFLYLRHRAAVRAQSHPLLHHLPLFLLAFLLAGVGPSSFVNLSWQWLYMAIIVVATCGATTARAADSSRHANDQHSPRR